MLKNINGTQKYARSGHCSCVAVSALQMQRAYDKQQKRACAQKKHTHKKENTTQTQLASGNGGALEANET